jgi:hypothetical protein
MRLALASSCKIDQLYIQAGVTAIPLPYFARNHALRQSLYDEGGIQQGLGRLKIMSLKIDALLSMMLREGEAQQMAIEFVQLVNHARNLRYLSLVSVGGSDTRNVISQMGFSTAALRHMCLPALEALMLEGFSVRVEDVESFAMRHMGNLENVAVAELAEAEDDFDERRLALDLYMRLARQGLTLYMWRVGGWDCAEAVTRELKRSRDREQMEPSSPESRSSSDSESDW